MTPANLRERRDACMLTLAELGERARLSKQHLSDMERGRRVIGPRVGRRIEDALQYFEASKLQLEEWWARRGPEIMNLPHLVELREGAGLEE